MAVSRSKKTPKKAKTPKSSAARRTVPTQKRAPASGRTKAGNFFGMTIVAPSIPDEEVVIKNPSALEALYNPTRHRLFKTLVKHPLSVREAAERMKMSPNSLYHHIRLLQKHGFVRLADARVVGNQIERIYGVAAQRFRFDEGLKSVKFPKPGPSAMVEDLTELFESLSTGHLALQTDKGDNGWSRHVSISSWTETLSPGQAAELGERISAVLEEYMGKNRKEGLGGDDHYASAFVLLPVANPEDGIGSERNQRTERVEKRKR